MKHFGISSPRGTIITFNAERHAVAERNSLALYRVATNDGDMSFDPAARDVYAFEHVARGPERVRALSIPIAAAQGFEGVLVFGSDDGNALAIVSRFEHSAELDAFRESAAAVQTLGPVGASGETMSVVHPVKTFA